MIKKLPSYYRKSKVMQELMHSLDMEMQRLKEQVSLTENQFFVLLADKELTEHEKDVGITPEPYADLDTRRGRILSKLRGTGTVTKTMMKNVAASFVNGDIEITEYPSEYLFTVTFTSKKGVPYNLADIQAMVEEIKPAHLAVDYIFTYRLWEDIKGLEDWEETKPYTWEGLLTFSVLKKINIINGVPYFCPDNNGNAFIVWDDNKAYARRNE